MRSATCCGNIRLLSFPVSWWVVLTVDNDLREFGTVVNTCTADREGVGPNNLGIVATNS